MDRIKLRESSKEGSMTYKQWTRSNSAHIGKIDDESDSEDSVSDDRDENVSQKTKALKHKQLIFNILKNVFNSKKIPEGSCFKKLTEDDLQFALKESQPIEIQLNNAAGFLRSEPPKNKNNVFGIIKPTGTVLYFHEPTREQFLVNVTDEKDHKKKLFEYYQYLFELKQFNYKKDVIFFKYCVQEDGAFEIYAHNKKEKPLLQRNSESVILLDEITGNAEKKQLVRKRVSIPLDKKYRETLRRLKASKEAAENPKRKKIFREESDHDQKKYEKQIVAMDFIHRKKLNTIDTVAMIDADIYKQAYCAKTIVVQTKANAPNEMEKYVDRLIPYKGKTLAELLSPNNQVPLTDEQKIDIAESCLRLMALNYNPEHACPKQLQSYVHGQLDLSHVCVLLASSDAKPEVSFVGFKGEKLTKEAYLGDLFALGIILMGISNETTQKNLKKGSIVPALMQKNGLLSCVNVETLDLARQHKYERLVKLANLMTRSEKNERPDAKTLWLTYKIILSYNCYAPTIPRRNAQQATESLQLFQATSELEEHLEEKKAKRKNHLAFLTRKVMNLLSRKRTQSDDDQSDKINTPRRSLSWNAHNENLQQLMNRAYRSFSMSFSNNSNDSDDSDDSDDKKSSSSKSTLSETFSRMLSFNSRTTSESTISSLSEDESPIQSTIKKKPTPSRSRKKKKKSSYTPSAKMRAEKPSPSTWESVFGDDKRIMELSKYSKYR